MTTPPTLDQECEQLIDWLHERALAPWRIDQLQHELIQRLLLLGFDLHRMHIGTPMLHPLYSIGAYNWTRDQGCTQDAYGRGTWQRDTWLRSPLRPIYDAGLSDGLYTLTEDEVAAFPILGEMRERGVVAYFAQIAGFTDRRRPPEEQEGVALAWSITRPEGFSEAQLQFLRKLRLPLAALIKSLAHRKLSADILDTYLGAYSGSRVLSGQIQRGDVESIHAVILFCDLRNSSNLASQCSPQAFLELLNQYYEVTAGAVIDQGGELLRFIGDASLAIFPMQKFASEEDACRRALQASQEALQRCERLNQQRTAQGAEPIRFGIGLHKGEVLYGNIGVPSRLEFTVIGAVANEAARIEGLCKPLGEPILASQAFQQSLNLPWRSHGQHLLKNISEAMEVFSPGPASPPNP